jgi:tetratricopeptide (TPR) repeat protein
MNEAIQKTRSFIRSKYILAATILILGCMTLLCYKLFFNAGGEGEAISLLKKAYNSQRPIKSRVAGFNYAPFISVRGQEVKPAPASSLEIDYAERALLSAVRDDPGARSYHALGVFHLLDKRFDLAIKEFEKALSYEQTSARLHSDLGAALLEKAQAEMERERLQSDFTGKPIEDLSRSLEHLRKALDIDGSLREAVYNLSLSQEVLGLSFAAKDTLSKYLEVDADSGWAREARERVARQEEKERALYLSKEKLLADFLDAFNKQNEDGAWEIISGNRSPLSLFSHSIRKERR